MDNGPFFEGIDALVLHYSKHSDGLDTNLLAHVPAPLIHQELLESDGNSHLQDAIIKSCRETSPGDIAAAIRYGDNITPCSSIALAIPLTCYLYTQALLV